MISDKERNYLKNLAQKQLELSNKPIMKEREKLWYAHNSLKGSRPMVIMEDITFWNNICPKLKCEDKLAREIEEQLYRNIVIADLLDDDKIIPDYYKMEYELKYLRHGIELKKEYAADHIGFHIIPEIECIEDDFEKLSPSVFKYNSKEIENKRQQIEDIIGDILPVKAINTTNYWNISLTQQVVELMGTENMFCSMMTEPEQFHKLMSFITEDTINLLRFEEKSGCMQLNNGNDYLGSGSYCFNDELPKIDYNGNVRSIDTWGHINSQESVGLSPKMYQEFVLPYMQKIAKEFGLIYYGCCEPVSDFWDNGVETIPNLRKVSISPWCNEEYMAPKLEGKKIIYSRKPSPNFLGIEKNFDEDNFRAYIKKTAKLTKHCKAEYIFRDIYDLHGNIDKIKRAIEITREETENSYC